MTDEPPSKRKCLGVDCDNDAGSLQCPTCLKLGIKDSFFCSQDCFKKSWVSSSLGRETMPSLPHLRNIIQSRGARRGRQPVGLVTNQSICSGQP